MRAFIHFSWGMVGVEGDGLLARPGLSCAAPYLIVKTSSAAGGASRGPAWEIASSVFCYESDNPSSCQLSASFSGAGVVGLLLLCLRFLQFRNC